MQYILSKRSDVLPIVGNGTVKYGILRCISVKINIQAKQGKSKSMVVGFYLYLGKSCI